MNDEIYLGWDLREALQKAGELINEGYHIKMRRGVDAWNRPDGSYIIFYNEEQYTKIEEKK